MLSGGVIRVFHGARVQISAKPSFLPPFDFLHGGLHPHNPKDDLDLLSSPLSRSRGAQRRIN